MVEVIMILTFFAVTTVLTIRRIEIARAARRPEIDEPIAAVARDIPSGRGMRSAVYTPWFYMTWPLGWVRVGERSIEISRLRSVLPEASRSRTNEQSVVIGIDEIRRVRRGGLVLQWGVALELELGATAASRVIALWAPRLPSILVREMNVRERVVVVPRLSRWRRLIVEDPGKHRH